MELKDLIRDKDSCLARGLEDEQGFLLLARDGAAPAAIRVWVMRRIQLGLNKPGDEQVKDALLTADAMDAERAVIRSRLGKASIEAVIEKLYEQEHHEAMRDS